MRTFEQLEARLPMTASVDLDGGTLTITGENKAESVEDLVGHRRTDYGHAVLPLA